MSTALLAVADAPAPAEGGGAGARERSERLGKNADNPSPAGHDVARERRNEAWALRRRLWELSGLERVRACGRVSRTEVGGPTLRVSGEGNDRRAGLAGLVSCGSPWACPVCARKIGARRAEEIRQVVTAADAAGGSAALITLTLRHNRGHRLAESWGALRHAWSRVVSGKAYQREREQFGVEGWCCAVEVTRGDEHGWHPHAHILVIFDTPMSDDMISELAGRWWLRWERALARKGFTALAERGGLDARSVAVNGDSSGALGRYLSKIAMEVTGGAVKDGRFGNRSPFALLRDGVATGLADDLEAWWEFEQASKGRRQLTWSVGIRDRYGLNDEQTDAEIAQEDLGSDDLIALPAETWRAVRDHAERLLTVAETDGLTGAVLWLTERGLPWSWATTSRESRPPDRAETTSPGT